MFDKKEYFEKYYKLNKERLTEYKKGYYKDNKEKIKLREKNYYEDNEEKIKKYYKLNKKKIKKISKKYYVENREKIKEYQKKWREENKGKVKEYIKKFCQTLSGKEMQRKHNHKRRQLGFIPLNNFFEGSESHHIDEQRVIFMPRGMHRSVHHSVFDNINMREINTLAFNWLEVEELNNLKCSPALYGRGQYYAT